MSEQNTPASRSQSSTDTSASAANGAPLWSLSMPLAETHPVNYRTATELKLIRKELSNLTNLLEQTVTVLWEIASASDGSEDEIETSEPGTYLDGTRR